jgi:hypothetical protein
METRKVQSVCLMQRESGYLWIVVPVESEHACLRLGTP